MGYRALLFDLDGTLLQCDCSVSRRTREALWQCRKKGLLFGVATARSEINALNLLSDLCPDIVISSGGALAKYKGRCVCRSEFTEGETAAMISQVQALCGQDCSLSIDTADGDYCNFRHRDASRATDRYTDFRDFSGCALRMCARLSDPAAAPLLAGGLADCGWIRFSHTDWYQFAKKDATKEYAVSCLCREKGLSAGDVIAFGDDFSDIGMLKRCGKGIAMGNAVDEVKRAADLVIGSHDEDGIAEYLTRVFL